MLLGPRCIRCRVSGSEVRSPEGFSIDSSIAGLGTLQRGGTKGRYDCVFVDTVHDPVAVARVRLFFKFLYRGTSHSCALIHWFMKLEDEPSELNGMWVVEHMRYPDGTPVPSIVGINTLVRSAHLLPLFDDDEFVSKDLECDDALDHFNMFYVNRYIDHHSFLIASQIPLA